MKKELQLLQKKARNLETLIEISKIVNSELDLNRVLFHTMEKAQEVMRAEASSIFLLNPETNRLEIQSALGSHNGAVVDTTEELRDKISLEIGQGIAGWVAQHRQPLNIRDARSDPRFFQDADKKTGFVTRSLLAAPLIVKEKLIGVAEVINRKDGRPFDEDDVALFSAFCSSVALSIENARLHKQSLERERMEQQLQSAQIIQQSFLPQELPVCPYHRFEVAASYRPAKMIGGDFYDFLVLDQDHLAIVFGDVSGKGIPAALYMARLLSDFHLYASTTSSLQEAVRQLNRILHARSRQGMFVTFLGVVLNAATGQVWYVNAGHLPLLRLRADNQQIEPLAGPNGIPLGIVPDYPYRAEIMQLDHGDFLVFITDGITEIRNPNNDELTMDGLMNRLRRRWSTPGEIVATLMKDLDEYAGESERRDDMTLIVLKYC